MNTIQPPAVRVQHFRPGTDDDKWVIPELINQDMYRFGDLAAAEPDGESVVLDCGAHIGVFSALCASHFRRATVQSFEPQPDNFSFLERNTAGLNRVQLNPCAVGVSAGEFPLYLPVAADEGGTGRWTLTPANEEAITRKVIVPVVSLEERIRSLGKPVFILKLDLEGFEAVLIEQLSPEAFASVKLLVLEEHHVPVNHGRLRQLGFELWFNPLGNARHFVYANRRFAAPKVAPKRNLRIAFVSHEYPFPNKPLGGIGVYVQTVARALSARGHDVHIITGRQENSLPTSEALTFHEVELSGPDGSPGGMERYSQLVVKKLEWIQADRQFDVVEFADWAGEGCRFTSRRGQLFVVRTHTPSWQMRQFGEGIASSSIDEEIDRVEAKAVEAAHIVTTPSNQAIAAMSGQWNLRRVERVPNPIDTEVFKPAIFSDEPTRITVLCVGRCSPIKGTDIFLRAAGKIAKQFPQVVFRVVGRFTRWNSRPADEVLKEIAREAGLPTRQLELVGNRDHKEIPCELQKATIFVNPSRYESFSYSSGEALASGLPLILTTGQGILEYLKPDEECLAVDVGDVEGLANALARLLANKELCEHLSRNGRKAAVRLFGTGVVGAELERIYREGLAAIGSPDQLALGNSRPASKGPAWSGALDAVSFCIITNGKRPEKLHRELDSIRKLNIPKCEILIAGKIPPALSGDIVTVSMPEAAATGQLGAMRNALIDRAAHKVLVVADDDLLFHNDFYAGLQEHGPDFDALCSRFLNPDGTRYWDWATFGGLRGHELLAYLEHDDFVYVTGGLCVIRAEVARTVRWDGTRGFYKGEDVDFSRRLRERGFRIKFNPYSTVTHDDPTYTQIGRGILRQEGIFTRATAIYNRGHFDEARRLVCKAVQLTPNDRTVLENACSIAFKCGDLVAALDWADRLLEQGQQDFCEALFSSLAARFEPIKAIATEEALNRITEFASDFPDLGFPRLLRARLLAASGRKTEALQLLYSVVDQRSDYVEAWRLGGSISLSNTALHEFADDWTRIALECHPNDEIIRAQRDFALRRMAKTVESCALVRPRT